ncbi:alpha-tocopherol transfer protein-like isoform X10 [Bacillus rossius redtenbacheri]
MRCSQADLQVQAGSGRLRRLGSALAVWTRARRFFAADSSAAPSMTAATGGEMEAGARLKQPFLSGLAEGEARSSRQELVSQLRLWLDRQPHLPQLTDDHLILFLHSRYDNVEKTKQAIESYCTLKTLTPEIFSNRDVLGKDIQDMVDICEIVMLPAATAEGYRVLMFRFTDYSASKYFLVPSLKGFCMSCDFHISENGLLPGVVAVFDMKGLSIFHIFRIHPFSMVKKILHYLQDCLPVRVKSIHLINAIFLAGKLLALIKPFLKKELAEMIHVHSSVEGLREFLPLDILPSEYGGQTESMTRLYDEQKYKFETEYGEWFRQGEDVRSDESKRLK